jgi:hypothetical protein
MLSIITFRTTVDYDFLKRFYQEYIPATFDVCFTGSILRFLWLLCS